MLMGASRLAGSPSSGLVLLTSAYDKQTDYLTIMGYFELQKFNYSTCTVVVK